MQRHTCSNLAAYNLSEGNLAEEGVSQSLEYEYNWLASWVSLDCDILVASVLCLVALDCWVRYEVNDLLENFLNALTCDG